jgi:23S rRNA pseudouridine2604 synthase
MNISLGTLPLGKWRNLSEAEVAILKDSVAESNKTSIASPKAKRVKKAELKPKATIEKIEVKAKPKTKAKEEIVDPKKIKPGSYKDFRKKGKSR